MTVLNQSILYDALFEELRDLQTLAAFWKRSVVKMHRNEIRRRSEKMMMASLTSVNPDEFWNILKFLVHSFPTPSELKTSKWEQVRDSKKDLSGLILSIQQTGEGLGKAIMRKPGLGLSENKEIENIRLDIIWSLAAYFSSFLTQINIQRKNQESM